MIAYTRPLPTRVVDWMLRTDGGKRATAEAEAFERDLNQVLRQASEQYATDILREAVTPALRCRQLDIAHAAVEEHSRAEALEQTLRTALTAVQRVLSPWAQGVLQRRQGPGGDGVSEAALEPVSASGTSRSRSFGWHWPWRQKQKYAQVVRQPSAVAPAKCPPADTRAICDALAALALLDVCVMNTNIAVNRVLIRYNLPLIQQIALLPLCVDDPQQPPAPKGVTSPSAVPVECQVLVVRARQCLIHWAQVMTPLVAEIPEFQQAAAAVQRDGLSLSARYRRVRRPASTSGSGAGPRPTAGTAERRPVPGTTVPASANVGAPAASVRRFYRAPMILPQAWMWAWTASMHAGVFCQYGSGPTWYPTPSPVQAPPNRRDQMLNRLRAAFQETRETIDLFQAMCDSFRDAPVGTSPNLETLENARSRFERVQMMRDGLASLVPRIVEPPLRQEASRLLCDAERALTEFRTLCETNAFFRAALSPDGHVAQRAPAPIVPPEDGDGCTSAPMQAEPEHELLPLHEDLSWAALSPTAPAAEDLIDVETAHTRMESTNEVHRGVSVNEHLIDSSDDEAQDTVQHPVLQPRRASRRSEQERAPSPPLTSS